MTLRRPLKRGLLFVLACVAAPLAAEPEAEEAPAPPAIIKGDEAASQPPEEPAVTIRTEDGKRIEEYRIRGRLYMIKVTPAQGPAYYLIDKDGDGLFETRISDLTDDITVPKWVLKEW